MSACIADLQMKTPPTACTSLNELKYQNAYIGNETSKQWQKR